MKGAKSLALYLKRASPTILSCLAGAGVVLTTTAAIKATPKATQLIKEAENEKGEKLTKMELVKTAGQSYIPTVLFGVSTIGCIIGSNVISNKRQASIASAYALLSGMYHEHKDKIKELYGEEVNNAIVRDKYVERDIDICEDDCLFYEFYYGEFFNRPREMVLQAEKDLNAMMIANGYVTLNDFYDLLDLPGIKAGDTLGWSTDDLYGCAWIDFKHELVDLEDGMECYTIDITTELANITTHIMERRR